MNFISLTTQEWNFIELL